MSKALVLAGGGAKGSYHIGAWQALIELGYTPDIVTGTSVGSMNAALVAMDYFEEGRAMWLALREQDVLEVPSKIFSKDYLKFVKKTALDKGMSVAPLEDMINRFIDEDLIRKSKCKYGLVAVNFNTLKPLELVIDDIPKGQLVDYIMASSACFPLLKMKEIDGQKFIDGGYYDNMPANLAAKMGATEIVEINLDSIGNNKGLSKKYKDIKLTTVKPFHDLGSILSFDPETARRNIEIGYLDTYKAFKKLCGNAYAFKLGELEKMHSIFGKQLFELISTVTHYHPAVYLSYQLHLSSVKEKSDNELQKFLIIVETAMKHANFSISEVYTSQKIVHLFSKATLGLISSNYEQLLEDTVASRLLGPIAGADLGGLFLSLIQQVI